MRNHISVQIHFIILSVLLHQTSAKAILWHRLRIGRGVNPSSSVGLVKSSPSDGSPRSPFPLLSIIIVPLGNMWAQTWSTISDIVEPAKSASEESPAAPPPRSLTELLQDRNYQVMDIVRA